MIKDDIKIHLLNKCLIYLKFNTEITSKLYIISITMYKIEHNVWIIQLIKILCLLIFCYIL
jgi:hypothetical protein